MPTSTLTSDAAQATQASTPLGTALRRFRVMAYVVGCWLLILVGVAMPLKYIWNHPTASQFVSPIHGALYIVYLLATIALSRRVGWSLKRTVGVMLAGTIPFVSFIIERRVVSWVQAGSTTDAAASR